LARSQVGVEKERFAALTSAGNLLFRLREYPAAADLLEAGSRGETNTAATTQRIAFLRKTKRDDGKSNPLTDPRGVTLRWFAEMLSGGSTDPKKDGLVTRLLAPGSEVLIEGKDSAVARRMLIASLARQDIPIEVAADLMFSNMRVNVEGDDAHGYRVQLRTPGATQTIYVVSLAGTYRILAMAPTLGPLATKALESIDANDLGGARKWLDWARADSKPASADDPLAGPAFPRAWTVGTDSDLAGARIAAALLLADSGMSERAIPLLLAAQGAATSAADKLNIDIALASAHLDLQHWPALLEVATRLVAAAPNSATAFRHQQIAYINLQQWDAAETAARARLARLPDDPLVRQMQMHRAEERGTLDEIRGIMQPVIDGGRATPQDYNQFAWSALLRRPVDEQAVDVARTAFDETQGRNYAISHTLACVYAATGKPREARDLLIKGMDQKFLASPDDATWYGFGLIAEAYGETESARDYYGRVEKPKKGAINASSVYALSQARLAALSSGKH
jgi:tetratricopeptide (TPR) repeat protein